MPDVPPDHDDAPAPPLDYEPRERRRTFWSDVPLVVKVFVALILAVAVARVGLWFAVLAWRWMQQ